MDLKKYIRDINDFPKPGIVFKDITPLLISPDAFKYTIDEMRKTVEKLDYDLIIGAEARGFIFGAALAYAAEKGFIPVRKPGKLPYKTVNASYELEYGTDELHMHIDAVKEGDKVLIVDDLLATGGTARALAQLVEQNNARVAGFLFVVELDFLKGREKLSSFETFSLLHF